MGPDSRKQTLPALPLLAAVIAGICLAPFAHASSRTRTPDRSPAAATGDEIKPGYMPQADAFETAAEHAVFLGAYQMSFGPYGSAQDPKERNKLLKQTAQAIDDCVNGRNCGSDKHELVLKALVQYNLGQDIKRVMLTNQTNREKMRSLEYTGEGGYQGKPLLSQSTLTRSQQEGAKFNYDTKSNPIRPYKSSGGSVSAKISRSSGTAKEPYFQLDESKVSSAIDGNFVKEREILGDQFLKEYATFIDDYSTPKDSDQARFYKYIPARESYVYDESAGRYVVDPRYEVARQEQTAADVQRAAAEYREAILKAKIEGKVVDGKMHITSEDFDPGKAGIGEIQAVDPAVFPGLNVDDLKVDGKLEGTGKARAAVRAVNMAIRHAASEKLGKPGDDRSPSSNTYVNVVLSPDSFGKFLDEIWPTGAQRRTLMESP